MTMQKSAIQKRIEAQLAVPSRPHEDSNVNDKKPVPPSLAQFALEQLAGGVEQTATTTNRAEEMITQLEAEILKRDARIAELEAESAEWSPLMQRLGDENEVLRSELKAQQPSADQRPQQECPVTGAVTDVDPADLAAWRSEALGLSTPSSSAGVVGERAAFERHQMLDGGERYASGDYKSNLVNNQWRGWQARARARARLNPPTVSAGVVLPEPVECGGLENFADKKGERQITIDDRLYCDYYDDGSIEVRLLPDFVVYRADEVARLNAGVVAVSRAHSDVLAAFIEYRTENFCAPTWDVDHFAFSTEQQAWEAWQARAALNACRAVSVPDNEELKVLRAFYRCCASITDQLADSPKSAFARLVEAVKDSAPSAKKGCTKSGCFPYCDCGSIDDAPSAKKESGDD